MYLCKQIRNPKGEIIMSTQLNDEQYTQAKGMVGMILTMAIAKRMDEENHFEKIQSAETPEAKLEAIHESERTIQKEFDLAFQDNEQAQRMKREIYGDFIKNHYEYFDLSSEDALGLEA
jgi:hypothetical protein